MSRTPGRVCSIVLLSSAFILPSATFGQQVYGSIYGTVTDPTGAGVPNAKITITDKSKGAKYDVTSNETGNYTKDRLIPGLYTVQVEGAGFRTAVSRDVMVNVDQASRLDVSLQVGNVSEQVEVTAAAPLLQSDRADVATTMTSQQIEDLPNLNRNFQSYELLLPGASKMGWQHASSENPQGSVQIYVNGQHFAGTGFQLDGTDNQDPILGIIVINPNLDSVTETKISSQNYDAEFAYAGSGLMNVSTKSGTNDFHGSAFEYLQNNSPGFSTIARDPFSADQLKFGVAPLKWNQFGGSIGGAIVKNKLFYFGDAQLTRRRTGSSVTTTVPTALARTGNFSEYLLPISGAPTITDTTGKSIPLQQNMIFDPATGDPNTGVGRQAFPNNTIPLSRMSAQAQALLKYIPLPNTPGQGEPFRSNFATQGTEVFNTNNWDTRIDYFINEKQSMFGRYSYQAFNKDAPGAFDTVTAGGGIFPGGPSLNNIIFAGTSDVLNQSLAIGYTRTFSPTLITDIRFGYMRYRVNVLPHGVGTSPAKDIGIPGLNLDNFFTSGMPRFNIQGDGGTDFGYSLGTNSCNCPLAQNERQFQFVDNTTKILGNHSIKIGADIRYALQLRVPSDTHRAGELTFSQNYTGYIPTAGAGAQQGLGWATFLLGDVTSFGRYVSPNTNAQERQKRFFWYAQDTWRVTPKLQLNYGLRWEMIFPETVNGAGNGGQLDLRTGQIAVFGVGQVSMQGIQEMNWHNFAPRLGVTYQLTQKTVVRAGYGWSYELGTFGSIFGHNVTQNLPVLANQSVNASTSFGSVFTLAQGPQQPAFPQPDSTGHFALPDGVNGKARPMTVILPRVMTYNFTVQRQISQNFSLSAGYVGNQGRHVFNGDGPNFNANQATWIPGVPNQNLRKPYYAAYGWTQGIDFYCNCATNNYNSLQIQAEKRYSFGYSANGSYTFQHATYDSGDAYTFLYNRPLGRMNTDFVQHHQFTLAQSFDVPFGKGRKYGAHLHPAVNAVLGGWMLSGITQWLSGQPFEPNIGSFPAGAVRPDVGPSGLPDIKAGADPYAGAHTRQHWFAGGLGDVWLVPANNQFGNFTRNGLFGPRFFNQDISAAKSFPITERFKFQLRADMFNAFNHVNLNTPNNNVTDPNAGLINSLAPQAQMRRWQFAGRLDW